MDKITISKTKAHQIYKNAAGKRVIGTTTALGILSKPALIPWANRLGLNGIDSAKYVDEKAAVGTLAHAKIMGYFLDKEIDDSEFSKKEIDQADNALVSFYEWIKGKKIEPILVEKQLVSEKYQYGGAVDLLAKIDGSNDIIDFKTGSGIYDEAVYQISGYRQLAIEAGYKVDKCRIVNVGRDESEGFSEKIFTNVNKHFELFEHCLSIYQLKKVIKKGS